jgi:hypothetical protein
LIIGYHLITLVVLIDGISIYNSLRLPDANDDFGEGFHRHLILQTPSALRLVFPRFKNNSLPTYSAMQFFCVFRKFSTAGYKFFSCVLSSVPNRSTPEWRTCPIINKIFSKIECILYKVLFWLLFVEILNCEIGGIHVPHSQ